MTTYSFKYELQDPGPVATNDGSSVINHDIYAKYRIAGSSDEWVVVPGNHKTISVPAEELQATMDMPHSTGAQKQAKNVAYKDNLKANVNTMATPLVGWTKAIMQQKLENNDASEAATLAADAYLTETLGLNYPIPFNI